MECPIGHLKGSLDDDNNNINQELYLDMVKRI
ncbi:uncharacterized protein G2W53_039188 [Senna tora]|uniref:Uncharacterized protein n=1 Tax=Senna tora TaxID=362788 RepID=A0A834SNB1_9FABA|nr:uncharacterized protein G2W53_039188 [Senna tora]